MWINFLKGHEQHCSIYVHSKNNLDNSSIFKKNEIKTKVPTTWANTMQAQIELLREALKDQSNKKFIFLSESTIPLQAFDYVYEKVMSNPQSIFGYGLNSSRYFGPLPLEIMHKNTQWVVLNREHAQLMVDDTKYLEIFTAKSCDNEHYPSTFLALHKRLDEVIKTDTTLCIWVEGEGSHPHGFADLLTDPHFGKIVSAIENGKFLFARKFKKECNLAPLKTYMPWLS